MNMGKIELLSPAGDMVRLKYAIEYGADAVYVGGREFSMRNNPANFDFESLKEAAEYTHKHSKKIYLACNTLPRNDEIERIPEFLKNAGYCGVDALIVADMGVLEMAKKYLPETEVHISTQAGIVNYESANAYYNLGAKRVVVARELSLDEIREIRDKTDENLEIEAFVHGAMCMSVSGHCVLSDYMAGRDANRGECAQPCRWKYYLTEETRPGEFFPVGEGKDGSYILNSKDLCMAEYIDKLAAAGIDSFKIEGRAKSEYYTAAVTNAYRGAIDEYEKNPAEYKTPAWVTEEINKISHREYSTGFYFGKMKNGQSTKNGGYIRQWEVAAMFEGYDREKKRVKVKQRNRFFEGEELEIMQPGKEPVRVVVTGLYDEDYEEKSDAANRASDTYSFYCETEPCEFAIFRRKAE